MSGKSVQKKYVVFSPNLRGDDALANYWMRQATVRLRREVAWLWHERGFSEAPTGGEQLPPFADKLSVSLDLTRHWAAKQKFLTSDVAAGYLSAQLAEKSPRPKKPRRGSFGWLVEELKLSDAACLALGLALTTALDGATGSVIAACLNDAQRIYPNLMLIQRLWDKPEDALILADPLHPLFARGLLRPPSGANRSYNETFWEQPLTVPALVARQMLFSETVQPVGLIELETEKNAAAKLTDVARLVAHRLREETPINLRVVPLVGERGAVHGETAAAISAVTKRKVWEYAGEAAQLEDEAYLNTLVTLCWLQDRDFYVDAEIFRFGEKARERNQGLPLASLPVTFFLPVAEPRDVQHIDPHLLLPVVKIPASTYEERTAIWKKELGKKWKENEKHIHEIARRFRYEKKNIRNVCEELKALPGKLTEADFINACRAETNLDLGELAAEVVPRFRDERLILPARQSRQFEEQLTAMRNLTEAHYGWGTAEAWNEGGITILFAGPPGTGKTMAAEVMAIELNLPMYRVDLSQVVNKYVGETEKNLKRIFDVADISDVILFFDEADSLFGKRTAVGDSRDRFANLEISYLLERMERFKGLAILATNRMGDLDTAFMRRLRYVIDFPVPEEAERRRIWEQVVPPAADASELDFDFLAKRFPLAGGNIRSIVFNACLQSANAGNEKKILAMRDVLVAVKREYDKMNRALSLEELGAYAAEIERLEQ